jgi:glucokinase
MLLAGDLGGTNTRLGLFERRLARPAELAAHDYQTLAFPDLPTMVREFLASSRVRAQDIEAACFGVAGAIHGDWADLTNVPWRVGVPELRERAELTNVRLLNDVEALAHSLPGLTPDELAVLHAGSSSRLGNAVLITVGTGFGQAFLHHVDGRPVPMPSEGGHVDFAARTETEIELLRHLAARFERVDVERVISGPGLANVADFTHGGLCPLVPDDADPAAIPALVSKAATSGTCPRCREALDLMTGALGSAAGNAAIAAVARGGVFIGGGIPPKILPALQTSRFLDAYRCKPPMEALLEEVPVFVILNDDAGLLGAAVYANDMP